MPACFRRHLVGKTLRNVSYSDVTEIRFVGRLLIVWTFSSPNWWHSSQLTPHIMPSYTHKLAIVSRPQILWRYFTLCIWQIVCGWTRHYCWCSLELDSTEHLDVGLFLCKIVSLLIRRNSQILKEMLVSWTLSRKCRIWDQTCLVSVI